MTAAWRPYCVVVLLSDSPLRICAGSYVEFRRGWPPRVRRLPLERYWMSEQ